jgi:hypothetical protein
MSAFYGIQPSLAYYKGTGGSVTSTSASAQCFPISFVATSTNISSALSFTSTGLKFTIPTTGTYTVSFNTAPASSGSPAITSVQIATSAGTGGAGLIYYVSGLNATTWNTWVGSGVATAGEVWTISLQAAASGTQQVGILSIIQNTRIA